MLKNILNLEGAQKLSKTEQKEFIAGKPNPNLLCYECNNNDRICPTGTYWVPPIPGSIGNGSCCPDRV